MDYPNKRSNRSGRISWSRMALWGLCILLALILVGLIVATIYAEHWLGLINREQDSTRGTLSSKDLEDLYGPDASNDPNFSGATIDPTDITWAPPPTETIFDGEEYVNIMLVGQDRRWNETVSRSDAMALLTFNKKTGVLYMTSFLRDTYVQIPGFPDNRINAAYALGGMELMEETIRLNFGVPVDGTVSVDFFRFPEIVDMLGGLDLTLTQKEADYLNLHGNWGLGPEGSDWTLTEGVNHMTGEQCLAYSRLRQIDSDVKRVSRQHNVLMAMLDKVKDLSLKEAIALLDQFLPMVTTNMTNQQILTHAFSLFPMLSDCEIKTQRVPDWGDYKGGEVNGMDVLVPDLDAIRKQLVDSLAYDIYATTSID